jgi:predicted nucleic acid-binding protein
MEVMVGATGELADATRRFLDGFEIFALDDPIAARAVELRRAHRIKLPDAIIWSTAQTSRRLLITRNIRDFSPNDPGIRAPYAL